MKWFVLLISVCMVITISECGGTKEINKQMKRREEDKDNKNNVPKRDSKDEESKMSTDRRDLKYFHVPKGNAYSYTHVVQTHGPVRKVVHMPLSYSSDTAHASEEHQTEEAEDDIYDKYNNVVVPDDQRQKNINHFISPEDPYFRPVYVTATPILAHPEGRYSLSKTSLPVHPPPTSQNGVEGLNPFLYPLFRPFQPEIVDKQQQYTVPLQVVYRFPYQPAYTSYQVPLDTQTNLNQFATTESPLVNQLTPYYANPLYRPFIHPPSLSPVQPYYVDNNYLNNYNNPTSDEQRFTTNSDESAER